MGGERSHYALTLEAYRSSAEGEGGHTDAVTTLRCSAASSSQKAKKEGLKKKNIPKTTWKSKKRGGTRVSLWSLLH